MNKFLLHMMAEMESWEAAAEFGISQDLWAEYKVRERSDDLYIACLSSIFDVLRSTSPSRDELLSLGKTLTAYSRSAAAKYLSGVEKNLNQLYSAAVYYLAGYPATANLLAKEINWIADATTEERILYALLSHKTTGWKKLAQRIERAFRDTMERDHERLVNRLNKSLKEGLEHDPRQYIASRLTIACINDFKKREIHSVLKKYAYAYDRDVWDPLLRTIPYWSLLPSQLQAIEAGLLSEEQRTFSLQMPTSAGKTALCELLIFHEVKVCFRRVLFLVPFRALASEIKDGMSTHLTNAGVSVVASYGGNIPTRSESAGIENADVLIITPEKFMALSKTIEGLEGSFQTILCDEGHLIDDAHRGLQYELLLTKLRKAERRMIFISAILPNVNEIHAWLGGTPDHLAMSTYRPVETDYAFLKADPYIKKSWRLDVNPTKPEPKSFYLTSFLKEADFRFINPQTGRSKLLAGWNTDLSFTCASALKASLNGPVAVFTTTRKGKGINGLAKYFVSFFEHQLPLVNTELARAERLPALTQFISFLFGSNHILPRLLKFGVGFHHGSLPQEVRREMEDGIQNKTFGILLCTNTLAEGVNLPIRTLVMHTARRLHITEQGSFPEFLPRRSIKNIIGRVGRAGKETKGRVIFINEKERPTLEQIIDDVGMEPAYGYLFQLMSAIDYVVRKHNITLSNEAFEQQDANFQTLMDNIDFTLLDLIPEGTSQEEITNVVDELLNGTLARIKCNEQQQETMRKVFQLRAQNLQQAIPSDSWVVIRRTGTTPRFFSFVQESGVLTNPLWQTLTDPLDGRWLTEIIGKLIDAYGEELSVPPGKLLAITTGWMLGLTYEEIAVTAGLEVDEVLELLVNKIGFGLQEKVATLCQIASSQLDPIFLSETALNWAALLQYGLGSLQQLDLFDRGASDRLGVWGITRILKQDGVVDRGDNLVAYLRFMDEETRDKLRSDPRVPQLSYERTCRELRI